MKVWITDGANIFTLRRAELRVEEDRLIFNTKNPRKAKEVTRQEISDCKLGALNSWITLNRSNKQALNLRVISPLWGAALMLATAAAIIILPLAGSSILLMAPAIYIWYLLNRKNPPTYDRLSSWLQPD